MATDNQNIFITKKQKLVCLKCKKAIKLGDKFVAESEEKKGYCFDCSPFVGYTLLAPGNVALTRRSKKHSTHCGVVLQWNQRRRRHERKGQYVEASAITKAQIECDNDQEKRAQKNQKAAEKRIVEDKIYIEAFAKAIREQYPNCPPKRDVKIAAHACEKYSGRVGRTADAKQFNAQMIELAVQAHIRHVETNYDNEFGKGKRKKEIRADLNGAIKSILNSWR